MKKPKFVFYVFSFVILDAATLATTIWWTTVDTNTKLFFSIFFAVIGALVGAIMWLSRDILFYPKRTNVRVRVVSREQMEYPYHIKNPQR